MIAHVDVAIIGQLGFVLFEGVLYVRVVESRGLAARKVAARRGRRQLA